MIYSKCKRYYKYRLEESFEFQLRRYGIKDCFCKTPFIELTGGRIIIKKGYAWDGASGPTIDTKSSMRASLVHDALYQLIRLKLLPFSYKAIADKNFYNICLRMVCGNGGLNYGIRLLRILQITLLNLKKEKYS